MSCSVPVVELRDKDAMAKRSPAYRMIRSRVTDPCPSDTWSENGVALVVFDLRPADEFARPGGTIIPQAVFALSAASGENSWPHG